MDKESLLSISFSFISDGIESGSFIVEDTIVDESSSNTLLSLLLLLLFSFLQKATHSN